MMLIVVIVAMTVVMTKAVLQHYAKDRQINAKKEWAL